MRRAFRGIAATSAVLVGVATRAEAQSPPAAPETIAVGDWQLAPSLQLRTRGEYWHDPVDIGGGVDAVGRVLSPRARDAGAVLERTRLGVGVERGPLRAQVTFQDARVWGSTTPLGTLGAQDAALAQFRPFEALVEIHTAGSRPTFFRFGRQVVEWGEGRLLGAADWSPTARSLDAARLRVAAGKLDVEVLASILETPRPLGAGYADVLGASYGGDQLYGVNATLALDPLFKVEVYGLAKIARTGAGSAAPPRAFAVARSVGETYTAALRVFGEAKGWRYGVEGAYQLGTVADFTGNVDRSAFAAAAHVTKSFDRLLLTPSFRLGGSLASGDDNAGVYKQFDPILPDVHAFHGAMDVFAWSNLIEGNVRATIVPWTETTIAVEYRYAQLYEAKGEWLNAYLGSVGRALGNTSKDLGHEIDGVVTWRPWVPLDLMLGYSMFVAGDGGKAILAASGRGALQANGTFSPSDLAHYAYLQATLRFP